MNAVYTSPETLKPLDLKPRLDQGERFQLIDVRSVQEFNAGHIPSAVNVPMELLESRLEDLHGSDPVVLICQSGRRASICKEQIANHRDDVILLEGGTKAWIDSGFPVVQTAASRLPLMRQVQLVVGPLVLVGSLLGRFVNPNWTFLATVAGAGLTLAGATGFCGMANLLALMPWNKARPVRSESN